MPKHKSCRVIEKRKRPRVHEDSHSLLNYRASLVIVKKCYKCPFYDYDSEYGVKTCNVAEGEKREDVTLKQRIPDDGADMELIPAMCPLRKRAVVVRLDKGVC